MRQPLLAGTEVPGSIPAEPAPTVTDSSFRCGDRNTLFVGSTPLRRYLTESGQSTYVRIAEQIDRIDVSPLLQTYSPIGRKAIHPRILLGLILFGTLTGRSSLRELEHLAICDVRAWWICRGEQPDHSTIGKFVIAHSEWIDGEGFQAALKQAIHGLGLRPGDAAIDGTVIESAASRLNMLKKDAARAAAEEATRAAAERPDDRSAQRAAASAQRVADAVEERAKARAAYGKPADHVRVAVSDPDAVNQPRKDDVVRPGFKASVIATEHQLIAGQHVDPSSETAAVEPLVGQHEQALGAAPTTLMADAAYNSISVLVFAFAQQIDILCPSGKATGADDVERKSSGKFGKRLFVYQPDDNTYRCPTGRTLVAQRRYLDRDGRAYVEYRGTECKACPRRHQCTSAANGRKIKRYDGDELKEAERLVMAQPAARAKYRQRSVIVEPIFGRLREMGLRRFRRRGLVRIRAEFALFCMAYNFKRADGIREARIAAFLVARTQDAPWAIVVWIATTSDRGPR